MRRLGGLVACLLAAVAAAVPAQASFPGKPGLLSYSSSAGYRDGSTSIRVRSPAGGAGRELLPHEDSAGVPDRTTISDEDAAWSPSGRRFVFARRTGGGNLRLFVSREGLASARPVLLPEDMYTRSPAFAPDGGTVVFVRVISGGDPSEEVTHEADWELWTVRTDGTRLKRLRRGDQPAWSPAGGRIAFLDACGSLWVMRTDGTGARRLVNAQKGDVCSGVGRPDFSPDGRRLVYSAGSAIYTVGVDGKGRQRIVTVPTGRFVSSPVWAPDGRTLVYERAGANNATDGIYRVPAGGGRASRILPPLGQDLAWQPRR